MRCAIYTRKSTEEGLEKAFNSLDAQREACEAFILSQQHEGWSVVPDLYDDGGFSGGSMERPALKQLLADVKAGRIDVVVVYKIDRLTRALADFAKIVDVLDAADASFVSVTQAFSTTTSMGRLTLNVLLSFAQFEREVSAERIRDKIAASKAKGMWMGGGVPLGYEAKDRKLIAVPEEATRVCQIMDRYLLTDSIRTLVNELDDEGIVSKTRIMRDGSIKGGIPFRRGALAWLLSNRVYVGEVVHRGNTYPGEHEAIVSREVFDAVQAKLAERTNHRSPASRKRVALLAGMTRDNIGRPMSPCHTRNHGRRYSYYASSMNDDASAPALRLPAGDLEGSVRSAIAGWLKDGDNVRSLKRGASASDVEQLFDGCANLAKRVAIGSVSEARSVMEQLEAQVRVGAQGATVSFNASAIETITGIAGVAKQAITIALPTSQSHYGHEPRLRLKPSSHKKPQRDERLVELLARAFTVRGELTAMNEQQSKRMPVSKLRHLQRTARISFLDPAIIRLILAGDQPSHLNARTLWRMASLPINWSAQREALNISIQ